MNSLLAFPPDPAFAEEDDNTLMFHPTHFRLLMMPLRYKAASPSVAYAFRGTLLYTWQALTLWEGECTHPDQTVDSLREQFVAYRADVLMEWSLSEEAQCLQVALWERSGQINSQEFTVANFFTDPLKAIQSTANQVVSWLANQLETPLQHPVESFQMCKQLQTAVWLGYYATPSSDDWEAIHQKAKLLFLQERHSHPVFWRTLAYQAWQKRQYAKAVSCYKQAFSGLSTKYAWLKAKDANAAGICSTLGGQQALALEWFMLAIRTAPVFMPAYLNAGLAMEGMQHLEAAAQHLAYYAERVPLDSRSAVALSRLYPQLGKWSLALEQLDRQQLLESPMNASDPWIDCDRVTAYLAIGDTQNAVRILQKLVETCTDHECREYARFMLSNQLEDLAENTSSETASS